MFPFRIFSKRERNSLFLEAFLAFLRQLQLPDTSVETTGQANRWDTDGVSKMPQAGGMPMPQDVVLVLLKSIKSLQKGSVSLAFHSVSLAFHSCFRLFLPR